MAVDIFPVGGTGGASSGAALTSGQVTSGFIGNAAVLSGSIGSGQISSGLMASGFIAGLEFNIASGSAQSGSISSGAVQGFFGSVRNIASGTVGVFDFGSGAVIAGTVGSGAIQSGNIGLGQVASGHLASGLLANIPIGNASIGAIKGVSGSYLIASGDYTVLSNVSGAPGTVTVPPAPFGFSGTINQGRILNIKKVDPSPNAVTVVGASGDLIDNAASQALTSPLQSIQIQTDGTKYWIL